MVKVKLLNSIDFLPKYQTSGAAGFDIASIEDVIIPKGKHKLVKTGLRVEFPEGYELQIRSRSGLAYKNGVFVLNSPGTIDSDYRGEIGIVLCNLGDEDFKIEKGMRIAQGILAKYSVCEFTIVEELSDTDRGSGGLGHTGTRTLKDIADTIKNK